MQDLIEDTEFDKTDFTATGITAREYENCRFQQCDFSGTDLSGIYFSDCMFDGCNLSMAPLTKTTFSNARFRNCKLMGMHFQDCNAVLFTVAFDHCLLDLSSFYRVKMKKAIFKDCTLKEADLTEADLSACVFDGCDFSLAVFDNTILEKADLRTAYNYSIDPSKNRIRKARFSSAGVVGLLDQFDIDIES